MTRAALLLGACVLLAAAPLYAAPGKVTLSFEPDTENLVRGAPVGLDIIADIAAGWHIQAHKPTEKYLIPTVLEIEAPPGVKVHEVNYPRPDTASFRFAPGKEFLVYAGKLGLASALELAAEYAAAKVPIKARLRYQACDDENCLPPATAEAEMVFGVGDGTGTAPASKKPAAGVDSRIEGWLKSYGYGVTFLLVAFLGLGLNLTPCVYPLISVTVSFFGTQAHGSTSRALILALFYVFGIAVTFSALGVAAALSGGLFGAALQKPVVLLFIAALMVLLALSCFGFYTLQPPPAVMRVAGSAATGALGAVFMGLTMGIVAAPCVGPAVLGLLTFVASRQDPLLGLALFGALSAGLGAPYLVLAVAAPSLRSLPRSGGWLMWVEHVFGFVLLGLAVYFIKPLLPPNVRDFALPALVLAASVHLGFFDPAGATLPYFSRLRHFAGVAGIAVALWMGWPSHTGTPIRWLPYSDAALAEAKSAGAPVVIDVEAEWCLPCKEMDATTFRHPEVTAEAEKFRMMKLDMTQEGGENDRLTEMFLIRGVPTTLFLGPDGEEVERKVGFVSAEDMLSAMRRASARRTPVLSSENTQHSKRGPGAGQWR